MDKKNVKDQLIKIHSKEAQKHLLKIKNSFRWKLGNRVTSLLEVILFRKKGKLSIEFLEEHLKTIEELAYVNQQDESKAIGFFSFNKKQEILFLVSDENVSSSIFGDTHVANDFKLALEENYNNINCTLENYKVANINQYDIVINMLWDTHINVAEGNNKILKTGWIRNYPERWVANTSFLNYDLFLCSSKKIVEFVKKHTTAPVHLFPIAANIKRFKPANGISNLKEICFVGNKWKEHRLIEDIVKSKTHQINVYGKGWDKAIGDASKGTIENVQIPELYKKMHLILDAANNTTQKWASLNSRIFNGIASKKIVLTNSSEAARLFKYPIPVYDNTNTLSAKIELYQNNAKKYEEDTTKLYNELKSHHTYKHRAGTFRLLLEKKLRIAIKIAAKEEQKKYFGDLYFAQGLAKAFQQYGHQVTVDSYENWYSAKTSQTDLVISLRGLRSYKPIENQTNFLWLISHPEAVTISEIKLYDYAYIASGYHFEKLRSSGLKKIAVLQQCTDNEHFYKTNVSKYNELLFVGNSRNVFRKSVRFALEAGFKIHVYGNDWKQFIPVKNIKGSFIPNNELVNLYNSYNIVLNDHWEDMLTYGYASNRLFDASACGAQVLSDLPKDCGNLIPGIHYYDSLNSFKNGVETIRNQKEADLENYRSVNNKHTFQKRAEVMLHQYYNTAYEKVV